ncbi:hypothetical protein EHS25_007648 [Saitozyma podzolica]|uniref:Uncharacterized protein n=1 Tax=Saitozyma podzolica TaxID=1890683 RepID=A0A427YQA4_9TREE|nr:hypothetical protein EHS25_007648 [Saitozyma podzolica]
MDPSTYKTSELFSVRGKVCIVTGAGSGIGKGMAGALAINGATVVICGRRQDVLDATAKELNVAADESGAGGKVIAIQADVATKQGVVDFYDKCKDVIHKLDFLVNNAGFSSNWKVTTSLADVEHLEEKLWSIDDIDWVNMTAVHVAGPYYLAVKFIPLFKASNDPSICNITSLATVFLNRAVCEFSYAQSKAAEAHMTRLMAAGLSPLGFRVNSVTPGLFKSELTTTPNGELYPVMERQLENIPNGRAGTWEEMAGPVMLFATPAGAYLNGSNILIDGGWSMNASAKDV